MWGADWVKERANSFIEDTYLSDQTNKLFFGIAQDEGYDSSKPITFDEFSKVTFGGNSGEKPQHYTKFKVDLETGEIEVLEHY